MPSRLHHWLHDPLFLLCLTAGLLAFVIQTGELETSDTTHRLQTTHWLWTSEPQVLPDDYPDFGLRGRGGRLYSWYGIGQSLLMLPADILGTWIQNWPLFTGYREDPEVRSIVVSCSTNILVNVLTALIAFRLLVQLGFSVKESVAGVLAFMLCTTHLHYTQNMMENNYIGLLTLAGFSYQYKWLRTSSRRALFMGSGALGLNLLTRLTTGLDLIAAGVFILLALWFEPVREGGGRLRLLWRRLIDYCKIAAPVYLFFLAIDRVYQFYRFESFTNTYVALFAKEFRQRDPTLPANFPWGTPFHVGVFGALFQPEKSIFLFDPLLVLGIFLLLWLWKPLTPGVRAYGVASLFLLAAYICFYARYTFWAGDFAWGDRYVSTSVELATLLAVPLLLRYREILGKTIRQASWALVVVSLTIQLASLVLWLPLEIYQMETFGHPTFVIVLRFKNIAAFALGKMEEWGLNTDAMGWDQWDYIHITTWNFLPNLLRRVGVAPMWAVNVVRTVWVVALAALGAVLVRLRNSLQPTAQPSSV